MSMNSNLLKDAITNGDVEYYRSVIVLCAGGTINMSGIEQRKPSDGVSKALSRISERLEKAGVSFISGNPLFDRPPDSSNIGELEWNTIIQRIEMIASEKERIYHSLLSVGIKVECGGIVVAHGTDTLHITSLVVALETASKDLPFPIIFTASHSTLDDPESDAIGNLQKSIYVAKERFSGESNLPPGVYVLIGQDIHLASRLTKVYTSPNGDGKYFYSFPSPVGQISSTSGGLYRFRVDTDYLSELTKADTELLSGLKCVKPWGIVEHIFLDKFIHPDVIRDFERRIYYYRSQRELSERAIGLIIQGDFQHNQYFKEIAEALKRIEDLNIIIYVGSKQTFLRLYENQNYKYLSLIPKSLSHQKAKIKLGWILKHSVTNKDITELMEKNIAGEIFSTDILPEWINFETFHNCTSGIEVVIAYPNIHSCVLEQAISRLANNQSPQGRKTLYLYGFGDGHYPTVNLSIAEIVNGFVNSVWGMDLGIIPGSSIENITSSLIIFIYENREAIINYLMAKYDLLPQQKLEEKLKQFIYRDEVSKATTKISKSISSSFLELCTNVGIRLSISDANLKKITEYSLSRLKIKIDEEIIQNKIAQLRSVCRSTANCTKGSLLFIAENYPSIIAQRLLKDSIMSSHPNMKLIGEAVDKQICVYLKTLAVKSKTDSLKYEIGNMLMLLGADSDSMKGNKNALFLLKY